MSKLRDKSGKIRARGRPGTRNGVFRMRFAEILYELLPEVWNLTDFYFFSKIS